jgi:hypothetical protein
MGVKVEAMTTEATEKTGNERRNEGTEVTEAEVTASDPVPMGKNRFAIRPAAVGSTT